MDLKIIEKCEKYFEKKLKFLHFFIPHQASSNLKKETVKKSLIMKFIKLTQKNILKLPLEIEKIIKLFNKLSIIKNIKN